MQPPQKHLPVIPAQTHTQLTLRDRSCLLTQLAHFYHDARELVQELDSVAP
jgi:hypothetical protein